MTTAVCTAVPDTTPPTQPGTLTATAVSGERGRPHLGRLDRQRRRHRLPGRALPGRRLQQLRPDRHHPTGDHATATPASPPTPATATASAPPTPPPTSAPTPTPPARPRPAPDTHAADAAGHADGDRGQLAGEIDLSLGRLDRQRRRHRLPGRTLPGRRLHQLRPDRRTRPARRYKDTGVSASTSYSYRVRATDAASNLSPYSQHRQRQHTRGAVAGLVAAYAFDEGRGRRSRTRRGTATRARSRTRPGRRPASTARRCSSTARTRSSRSPTPPSLHLSTGDDARGVGQPADGQRAPGATSSTRATTTTTSRRTSSPTRGRSPG